MSDEIANGFIAGFIGLAAAVLAAALTIAFTFRHDQYRRALQTHRDYLSWLRGLIPECDLITASINEVTPIYLNMLQGGQLQCPTKQLNSDFLAGARLGVIKHPRAAMLFPKLTNAYRDVVHTNEMMTRYEIRFDRAIASINPRADLLGILQGVCACMPVVRASVQALRHATQEQQQLEEDHPPTIWDVD